MIEISRVMVRAFEDRYIYGPRTLEIIGPKGWRWRRIGVSRRFDQEVGGLLKQTHGRLRGDLSRDEYVYFPKPLNLLAWLLKRELHLVAHVLRPLCQAHPDYRPYEQTPPFPGNLLDWLWDRIHDASPLEVHVT